MAIEVLTLLFFFTESEEVVVLENAGGETSVEAMFSQGGDACHGGDDTFSQGGDDTFSQGGVACQTDEQDHTVDIHAETLRKISSRYDRDKKFWAMAVSNLEEKIKVMKEQHFQLSFEAHKCANSIPDWTIMISAIQSLGRF
ncbi:hypothetical protein RHSIM_Rhsim02G0019400 [Rhododendron simsii]|uniref:Uncharacterized protein n=1 Tax=Rhododendron simsii TaxID=118357 RepID=A0A834LWQ9_RHOSS|nr:hypothetical protein RHSIM_Rhsim02G0019400 [Rhododendron simsii]